jgi:hypothetical protein
MADGDVLLQTIFEKVGAIVDANSSPPAAGTGIWISCDGYTSGCVISSGTIAGKLEFSNALTKPSPATAGADSGITLTNAAQGQIPSLPRWLKGYATSNTGPVSIIACLRR